LIHIPNELTINERSIQKFFVTSIHTFEHHERFESLFERTYDLWSSLSSSQRTNQMGLFLMFARLFPDLTPWYPYLESLPSTLPSAMNLNHQHFSLLQASPLVEFCQRRSASLDAFFSQLYESHQSLFLDMYILSSHSTDQQRGEQTISTTSEMIYTHLKSLWRSSLAILWSRTISLGNIGGALVPMADMFNANENSNNQRQVRMKVESHSGDLFYYAATDLHVNEEIRTDYGQFSKQGNEQLFFFYGFTLESNPYNALPTKNFLGPSSPLSCDIWRGLNPNEVMSIEQLIEGSQLDIPHFMLRSKNPTEQRPLVLSSDLLVAARICCIVDQTSLSKKIQQAASGMIDVSNEKRALSFLKKFVLYQLNETPYNQTTIEQDKAELDLCKDRLKRDLIRIRLGEKEILKTLLEDIELFQQALG